jgi:hypothetical protein
VTNGTDKSRCGFLKQFAFGALAAVAFDPRHRLDTNDLNRIALLEV